MHTKLFLFLCTTHNVFDIDRHRLMSFVEIIPKTRKIFVINPITRKPHRKYTSVLFRPLLFYFLFFFLSPFCIRTPLVTVHSLWLILPHQFNVSISFLSDWYFNYKLWFPHKKDVARDISNAKMAPAFLANCDVTVVGIATMVAMNEIVNPYQPNQEQQQHLLLPHQKPAFQMVWFFDFFIEYWHKNQCLRSVQK